MVLFGIDRFFDEPPSFLQHQRIGLVTHYGMTDTSFVPTIDRFLHWPDAQLVALYGPEHGVQNCAKEGEPVSYQIDLHSGLPAFSLYGEIKEPTADMLNGIDILVVDLQDIGSRYFTNISTLYYCLKAGAENQVPVIVLDRPNPIGGVCREGYPPEPNYQSFVGITDLPPRHGMTLGEIARYIQDRHWPQSSLSVIPMVGWKRSMYWMHTGQSFISPSPNTTHPEMALLYPGTCLFEGTNVSVGRGTVHPFEWIGAPWADGHRVTHAFNSQGLPGVVARPVYFVPTRDPYAGEICQGVQIHVTQSHKVHSLLTGIALLQVFRDTYPEHFRFRLPSFDLLAGGPQLRYLIDAGQSGHFLDDEVEVLSQFEEQIAPYLLYD
ncbi:hypothetical protein TPY_1390 [Sulfobacillus acidophilus TPY]|uniref:Uncharacterized conserved protein UCP016719 n=1 Tax=Sulfobacillus acidophilus (strain ATCC 700253 / DSM 10332 / NAL) TaxID=679936 RepID=G8TU66_SULAD|nr:hypothetical protein TPY_1390 [Sulfobacillus acidophilus TPY]AEW05738.1 Uncharacterized conserved protein UCP016719 [Sulfobacillus acidophilus DSM 10332]